MGQEAEERFQPWPLTRHLSASVCGRRAFSCRWGVRQACRPLIGCKNSRSSHFQHAQDLTIIQIMCVARQACLQVCPPHHASTASRPLQLQPGNYLFKLQKAPSPHLQLLPQPRQHSVAALNSSSEITNPPHLQLLPKPRQQVGRQHAQRAARRRQAGARLERVLYGHRLGRAPVLDWGGVLRTGRGGEIFPSVTF